MHITKTFKNPMLKRKYKLLFDIVSKVILGVTFRKDVVTTTKLHQMSTVIDKADVDWLGLLKRRLLEEVSKFVVDNKFNNYVLASTINMINKVSMIFSSPMLDKQWDENKFKPYRRKQKVMMIYNE